MAERCKHRHQIVVGFLRAIGVDEETAERDAEGIEHHVSEETLRAFERYIRSHPEAGKPGDLDFGRKAGKELVGEKQGKQRTRTKQAGSERAVRKSVCRSRLRRRRVAPAGALQMRPAGYPADPEHGPFTRLGRDFDAVPEKGRQAIDDRQADAEPLDGPVAIASTLLTPIWSISARKRRSARSARSTASAPSCPVVAIERPRPHSTFSLNSGVGARVGALVDDEPHRVRADIDDGDGAQLVSARHGVLGSPCFNRSRPGARSAAACSL